MSNCVKCHRALSNKVSIERQMGPICAGLATTEAKRFEEERCDSYDLHFDNVTQDIVCKRQILENGHRLHFNIYPLITHHSPSGWEWGYSGSGCADFALNIVEFFIRQTEKPNYKITDYSERQPRQVKICYATLRIYQTFKARFIASMPHTGGTIKGDDIRAFITEERKKLNI